MSDELQTYLVLQEQPKTTLRSQHGPSLYVCKAAGLYQLTVSCSQDHFDTHVYSFDAADIQPKTPFAGLKLRHLVRILPQHEISTRLIEISQVLEDLDIDQMVVEVEKAKSFLDQNLQRLVEKVQREGPTPDPQVEVIDLDQAGAR